MDIGSTNVESEAIYILLKTVTNEKVGWSLYYTIATALFVTKTNTREVKVNEKHSAMSRPHWQ
jgi:hypothetical protein